MVIDNATVGDRPATRLLAMFAGHRGVELYSTERTAPWRVEISDEPNENNALEVRYVQPDGIDRAGIWAGDGVVWYAEALSKDLGLRPATTIRLLRLRQAALHHQIDAIVTDIAVPRGNERARPGLPLDLTSPENACSVLGLYLRAHNDFTVDVEGGTRMFLTSERFYRAAVVAALDGGTWLAAADEAFVGGNAAPMRLLGGMTTRLAHLLRMRDVYAVRLRHWRADETWDESLALFEASLLFLGGALDAAARYLAIQLDVPAHGHPSFRNNGWMAALVQAHDDLERILAEEGQLRATASAIASVRNLIHERAPSEVLESYHDAQPVIVDHQPGVVVLDGRDAVRLSEAVERLGGARGAGLQDAWPGAVTVLPFVLLPTLVNATFSQLRRVVQATARHSVTSGSADGVVLDATRHSERLLLLTGLSPDP